MKAFYGGELGGVATVHDAATALIPYIDTRARVAVYDAPAAAPYVEEIGPAGARDYIEELALRVFELAHQRGGSIPYSVVREVAENLIHAGFAEPIVSVLDQGRTIRFSDQGPGILDKDRALQPGFTTATATMKQVIRGVGSGLPIVRDFLAVTGGSLSIEDNLSGGSVVTISCISGDVQPQEVNSGAISSSPVVDQPDSCDSPGAGLGLFVEEPTSVRLSGTIRLTKRQKQVLALVLESGSAGPSLVSRELGVGLSTAYRDLASLEDLGFISSEAGKRTLTEEGLHYLGDISSASLLKPASERAF